MPHASSPVSELASYKLPGAALLGTDSDKLFTSSHEPPPFPSDLPVATLARLSFGRLAAGDVSEAQRLFRACTSDGFFHLDLTDSEQGLELLDLSHQLLDVTKQLFNLPMEEKDRYALLNGSPVLGYKAAGVGKIDRAGTPDRVEFWGLRTRDVLGLEPPLPSPPLLEPHRPLYARFMQRSHALGAMILDRLDVALDLPVGTLAARHRIDHPSMSQTRQLRTLPQPEGDRRTSLIPHTDFGSVTVLFGDGLGGLQVLPPEDSEMGAVEGRADARAGGEGERVVVAQGEVAGETGGAAGGAVGGEARGDSQNGSGDRSEPNPAQSDSHADARSFAVAHHPTARREADVGWLWVRPRPGCATVNVGDALKALTGGVCRSVLHRVTFPPGAQASLTRHSLAYFVRPEDRVELRAIREGRAIPWRDEGESSLKAGDWVSGGVQSYRR